MSTTSTAMPSWFHACLTLFLAAWRQKLDDPAVGRAYWDTLGDCQQADVEAASLDLRRHAGGEFPPSAATWYATASRLGRERRLREVVTAAREEPWRVECAECDDTGWWPHQCDGSSACGRTRRHEPHPYVAVCPCRPSNRTYQRKLTESLSRARSRAAASESRRKGGSGWTKASDVSVED